MRRNILFDRISILSPIRLWRKGKHNTTYDTTDTKDFDIVLIMLYLLAFLTTLGYTLHIYSLVTDCVLFAACRNYPTHVFGSTIVGKISSIYNDFGHSIYMCNRWRVKCTF